MDPNEALRLAREAAGELRQADDDDTLPGSQVGQLVDAFEALDEWLTKGGFVPSDWRSRNDLYFVEIVYNTDPEGKWVDDNDWSNRTLHGPFTSEDDAHTWLDTRTDGDKDVKDVVIGVMNKADPERPFVNALPGEPEPRIQATCRHCQRTITLDNRQWIDLEATGDDRIWRETCGDNHNDRVAEHEPEGGSLR